MSLATYQRVRAIAESPRATEYRLVGEITGEMLAAWDGGLRGPALMPSLHRNREMWSAFSAACGTPGNALPDALRASIISIALWVDRYTSDVVSGRESIDPLVEVNRSVLEGLAPNRAQAAAAA
jgi:flagellar protein FlaF